MKKNQQSGFIMMVMIVIMVVGAAAYFGGLGQNLFQKNLTADQLNRMKELQAIKEKLLEFAAQHDQVYSTKAGNTGFELSSNVPGPGYFPCPINLTPGEGEGKPLSSCSVDSSGYIQGFLPDGVAGRNFFFTQEFYKPFATLNQNAKRYYYVAHGKFVMNNPALSASLNYYVPLNSKTLITPTSLLSLDGSRQYIVLLISPGKPQTFPDNITQNRASFAAHNFLDYGVITDGDGNLKRIDGNVKLDNTINSEFFNRNSKNNVSGLGVNDIVIGITLKEWQEAMLLRVKSQKILCDQINPSEAVWFNAHVPVTNPIGGGWREIICL